jgi:hypothetical protein
MHGRSYRGLLAFCVLLLAALLPLRGQTDRNDRANYLPAPLPDRAATGFPSRILPLPKPLPPIAVPPGAISLPLITRAAGTIFSGTVVSIVSAATTGQAIQTVSITFRVESALRGTLPGQALTIQQWSGLWRGGQHYRVGDHLLLFLYPPSKLGLTSCVAGTMGRFVLDSAGQVVLSPQQAAAFATDHDLGAGKSRLSMRDFAQAVARAGGEE